MKKLIRVLCAVLALVLLLTACGGPATPAEEAPAKEEGSAAASSQENKRTDVNISIVQNIATLNPWDTILIATQQLLFQLYDPLMWVNDAGELEPRIATSYEISEDGCTYTFKIRDDVYFHNGAKLTAEDVAWSANYAIKDGPWLVMEQLVPTFEKAEVIDETTVAVTTTSPSASFLNAFCALKILCKDEVLNNIDKMGVEWVPCGAGPYVVTSYLPDSEVKLEAFDKYYRGEAAIKNANVKIILDNNTLQVAFESGELDLIVVPTASWERISSNENFVTELSPTQHTSYVLINGSDPDHPLSNPLVRQAMFYACDREAMVIAAYDGLATPAVEFFNPDSVYGALDTEGLEANGITTYEYNPEKAKELLAEAGYPDGVDIGRLIIPNSSYWPKLATAFQQFCAEVGITMEQELVDSSTAGTYFAAHDYNVATGGMNVDNGEICFMHSKMWLATEEDKANGSFNQYTIEDPELEAAFVEADSILDPEARKEAYVDIIRILSDKAYIFPVMHKLNPYAWDADLNVEMTQNYYYLYNMSWK